MKEIFINANDIIQGIVSRKNFIGKKGIFVLTTEEKNNLNLSDEELQLIKPFYTSEELFKYYANPNNKMWIIYTNSLFKNITKMNNYPNIKKHLDKFKDVITSDYKPYGLHRSRDEKFFLGEKIISVTNHNPPIFTYTDFSCYVSSTFNIIKSKNINMKYLICILNSKKTAVFLNNHNNKYNYKKSLEQLPIPQIPEEEQLPFVTLVDYILFLKENESKKIDKYVDNSHIAQNFEKLIDAMVVELYFKEDVEKENLEIIKHVQKDFKAITPTDDFDKKAKIILDSYELLNERNNIIRNNLLLLPIKLSYVYDELNKV